MKTYQIRKAILKALAQYGGTPCSAEEVADYPAFSLIKPTQQEIEVEWQQLKNFGFIRERDGFGGEYCMITQKGLEQVNIEFKKDPFIHGPHA